ncbi:MAG: hypothetical protein DHS20C19_11670 [Acidimicrobiales bacterium]|nr:MAG: hypothetical protein DHS20C19_11670 [Acidimicrobiales bacterium]
MAPTFPFTGLDPVEVFAVEDTVAQLVWRGLPAGEVGIVIDGRDHVLGDSGVAGAADIGDLRPAAGHAVDITVDGRVVCQRTVHTEPAIEGDELLRIATISDLHLGEEGFGLVRKMREHPQPANGYPLRCAKAAARAAVEWGADLLVLKGDITDLGYPEHWELLDELLADIPIPVMAIPGNHDTVGRTRSLDATAELQRRGLFPAEVQYRDVEGVRIVGVDTTCAGRTWGRIRRRIDDVATAIDTPTPAMVFMHHHLETHHYPRIWPIGTPLREARGALSQMLAANPDLLISSGHTHRNRVRHHDTALITEVGSTKDFPGVWAGYVVHAAGVRQVVRRVADPDCLEWTDRTHAAVGGIWGRWSPGRMADRCITKRWSRAVRPIVAPTDLASLEA